MPTWIVIGVCAAIFVAVIAAAGAFNVFQSPLGDEDEPLVPNRATLPKDFVAKDIDDLDFTPAVRGYRMAEVDAVLAVLQQRLHEYEHRAQEADSTDPTV